MSDQLKVLVVDDNSVDREAVRRLLEPAFKVSEASHAAAGLIACRHERPHCVLLDHRLPDRSGLDTLREMLGCGVAIIILTGARGQHLAVEAMKAGAHDYLEKSSLSQSGLARAVRNAVERSNLQQQLVASQRMDAVGRLAGGIAHDFNNLLTVITSFTDIVLDTLQRDDQRHDDLLEVKRAARNAADLTSQLLAFSRQQPSRPRSVKLSALVKERERMLRQLVGESVDLSIDASADCWPVRGDPRQIEQVLMNLVINARDALDGNGRVEVEVRNRLLGIDYGLAHGFSVPPGAYVCLTISDDGPGMPADVRSRIFEPFFTTKAEGQGTGLGLATCHGIVRQAGGYIWVYSEVGSGTAFKVYLPRSTMARTRPDDEQRLAPIGGDETVLLVEDNDAIRKLAKRILERAGYKVIQASDGSEALATVEAYADEIHLLLTDVIMPKMNGGELARRIQGKRPGLETLYTSGYTANAINRQGLLDPGVMLLQKPFGADSLLSTVRRVLDDRRG